MLFKIVAFLIEFGIETVFLFVAMWIMILLQKLDYNLPGLLGSVALASGVDCLLNRFFGIWFGPFSGYFASPFFLIVLYVCLRKLLTSADHVDVIFTMCVGGALRFAMYMFLFTALMPDLRPSARTFSEHETMPPPGQQEVGTHLVAPTPVATNPPAPGVPTNLAAPPKPTKPVAVTTNLFSVRGVTQNASKSAVTIQTGKQTYTIMLGESALTQTAKGPVSVRFKELGDDWVLLVINGEETKLPRPKAVP